MGQGEGLGTYIPAGILGGLRADWSNDVNLRMDGEKQRHSGSSPRDFGLRHVVFISCDLCLYY